MKNYKGYIVIECQPLNDQYECDCNRSPLFYTTQLNEAMKKKGKSDYFEVWGIREDNRMVVIKEWDT